MSSSFDQLYHDLSIAASVMIPLITSMVIIVKKLIAKGKTDASKDITINLLVSETEENKKQLQVQSEEIADLKENQHVLKEDVLKEISAVRESIAKIEGTLSNLK